MTPSILVGTWGSGLFTVTGDAIRQELADQTVCSLAADDHGRVLAIVGGHSLRRRSSDGEWTELAQSECGLACCVPVGDAVLVGTDDARILRIDPDGRQQWLTGLDTVAGRASWYAGTAVIDGKVVGPPLGIRSLAASCDDAVLLANVHVGGIPRSADGGRTWQPTIDIESDVHQVSAHAARSDIAAAASAAGLCVSRDAGATWAIQQEGLHALHCSAVALGRSDIFVSAATGQFAEQGAVYRRPIDGTGSLQPLGGGFPRWIDGVADTSCIATRDAVVAVVDRSGSLYVSTDDGVSWSNPSARLPSASGLCIA